MDANATHFLSGTTNTRISLADPKTKITHLVYRADPAKGVETVVVTAADQTLATEITGFLNELVRNIKPQRSGRAVKHTPIFASELDVDQLLSRAATKAGVLTLFDDTAEQLISKLAQHFKVKCTDCGHYPGQRGNGALKQPPKPWPAPPVPIGGGYKIQELTPELEKSFEKKDREITTKVTERGSHGIIVSYKSDDGPCCPDAVYMRESGFQDNIKSLVGRILTVFDATLIDPTQREAMKSLIRREVRTQLNRARSFYSQNPTYVDDEEEVMTQVS